MGRRIAPISILQTQARQSLVFYATTKEEVIKDLLLGMRIEAKLFADKNVLIVPVLMSFEDRQMLDFSPQLQGMKFLQQGSIALVAPASDEERDIWGEIFSAEFDEAATQGMEQ